MPRAPREPQAPGPGSPTRVTLARVVRPRGRIGEVAAEILTDFPQHLTQLQRVFLVAPDARTPEREMRVRRCWLHQDRAVFHFEGVDSIDAAEKLRGCEVQLPLSERLELPAGKYFVSDLIGCEVFEVKEVKEVEEVKESPAPGAFSSLSFTSSSSSTSFVCSEVVAPRIGVVRDITFGTGAPLLVVDSPRGELLIPFAEDICRRIDVRERRIEIAPPEGLLDLNATSQKKKRERSGD